MTLTKHCRRCFLPLLALLPVLTGWSFTAAADSVVFLVRHAEKTAEATDPPLSGAGRDRAQELANLLEDAGVTAVHTTDFRRTRQTAEPLARRLGLEPSLYDPQQPDALVAAIEKQGGRHLVVGHSNTVPELVVLLGGDGGSEIDEAGEYDRLYVVMPGGNGPAQTVLLRYGNRFSR
jgi:phosphohistidine phosphatase SixA